MYVIIYKIAQMVTHKPLQAYGGGTYRRSLHIVHNKNQTCQNAMHGELIFQVYNQILDRGLGYIKSALRQTRM